MASAGADHQTLMQVYKELVQQGALREDPQQRRVAKRLDKLSRLLQTYTPPPPSRATPPPPSPAATPTAAPGQPLPSPTNDPKKEEEERAVLRGMYLHGHVGTGKSLLMDLFFHHCPMPRKRRVHFHAFMLEVHARIHAWKQRALKKEGRQWHVDLRPERNAIVQIAREIGQEATLLCFDEFQVTDVADAIIMTSLFGELWRHAGVVVVATSNRAPDELYLDGLNRPYFLPFIGLLKQQCVVLDMDSERDHRQSFARRAGGYFYPLNDASAQALDAVFLRLTGGKRGTLTEIPVMMGRTLQVPEAVDGVCRFQFGQLCQADVFAADYKAVAEHFHTVVLEGVPCLSAEKHNEARRFITLVDVLYETRTKLLLSAAAPVTELFEEKEKTLVASTNVGSLAGETRAIPAAAAAAFSEPDPLLLKYVDAAQELVVPEGELASVKELAFAFQRAASRLVEMNSEEYMEEDGAAGPADNEALFVVKKT